MKTTLLAALILFPTFAAAAPPVLTYYGGPFDQVFYSSVDWGDYDGDGDLDLVLTGQVSGGWVSWIYRNDGGLTFTRLPDVLTHVGVGSTKWGDYDGDGDLDILLTGANGSAARVSKIYRNDGGGAFVDIGVAMPGVWLFSSVDWGDADNDGDLDFLLSGEDASGAPLARLYRNDAGHFSNAGIGLTNVRASSATFADYDGDGDLDIGLSGGMTPDSTISKIYRNNGGMAFSDVGAALTGMAYGSSDWGDMDADGDLDLVLTGMKPGTIAISRVYRNDAGSFVDLMASIEDLFYSSTRWADADDDGDLDLHLTGIDASQSMVSKLYLNDGSGHFTDSGVFIEPVGAGQSAWADVDNDGDLDFLVTGYGVVEPFSALYRNDAATANTPPSAPGGLSASTGPWLGKFPVTFRWSAATDAETPSPALTYNLRVGHSPSANDVMPSMSLPNGYRRVVRRGNVDHNLEWTLHLPPGQYYWSVQAVDAAYAGSAFATEQAINVAPTDVPSGSGSGIALRALPNPFASNTTVEFEIARASRVALRVYDIGGRLVRDLSDAVPAGVGRQRVAWDGLDDAGQPVAAGVYLCALDAGGVREQVRIARLK